jgi:hypothetical protein
MLNDDHS